MRVDLPRTPAGKKVKTVKPGSEISHFKQDVRKKILRIKKPQMLLCGSPDGLMRIYLAG
jgi:hypothetical protein